MRKHEKGREDLGTLVLSECLMVVSSQSTNLGEERRGEEKSRCMGIVNCFRVTESLVLHLKSGLTSRWHYRAFLPVH